MIFQFALEQAERMLAVDANDKAAKENKDALNAEMVAFEKRHGNRKDIEDVIVKKRRDYYEQKLEQDSYDYDSWFDLARLEEAEGNFDKVREVYERAISNSPPIPEKRFWRRYIYLWISYAIFEELQTSSIDRARSVYRECLRLIPHKEFTFGKIWLMAAQLEVPLSEVAYLHFNLSVTRFDRKTFLAPENCWGKQLACAPRRVCLKDTSTWSFN